MAVSLSIVLVLGVFTRFHTEAVPLEKGTIVAKKHADVPTLPPPDGRLNLYMLPTGQGDSHLIQCPDGTLSFFDLGASDAAARRFWHASEIHRFLGDAIDDVRNVFISHNHRDHYDIFPHVFDTKYGLENIYISCTPSDFPSMITDWINDIEANESLRTFNDGETCGPNDVECEEIDLCPNDPEVTFQMMAANLGQHCSDGGNKNADSLILKIMYDDVSILYTGDFEDRTTSLNEDGPQKQMVDYYGDELMVTIYHVAHHGASTLANKPIWRNALRPKAIFTSSNPWYSTFRHPRCLVFDGFINEVGSLCKPEADWDSEFYCGERVTEDTDVLQPSYYCGSVSGGDREERSDNEFAIYTSVPSEDSLNLVSFTTDGHRWQFNVQNLPTED